MDRRCAAAMPRPSASRGGLSCIPLVCIDRGADARTRMAWAENSVVVDRVHDVIAAWAGDPSAPPVMAAPARSRTPGRTRRWMRGGMGLVQAGAHDVASAGGDRRVRLRVGTARAVGSGAPLALRIRDRQFPSWLTCRKVTRIGWADTVHVTSHRRLGDQGLGPERSAE
jgi:hypothetical protein